MRYNDEVFFCKETREYDESTGDYSATVEKEKRYACVYDTRTEFLKLIYGRIFQGSLTIQLQNHYPEPFDYIEVGDKAYNVDYSRSLRTKQTFIVSARP